MTQKWKNGRIESQLAHLPTFPFPHLLILGIILLAAWLRLWRLDSTPPGLWFDEGFNGMEAAWMLKSHVWPVFILGGQGREVMFFYLVALSISILGEIIYAVRLAPALLGILSTALMYRWVLTLFASSKVASSKGAGSHQDEFDARWVALISAAGLAVSFWYLVMNRVSYRANTLLPVLLFTSYFFWRGWQTGKTRWYLLAGLGLGLCQYTYLAGRLAPLIFLVFVSLQTLIGWKNDRPRLKNAWLGLLVMAGLAGLLVMPLALFFINHPELIWERTGDVALKLDPASNKAMALLKQLASAGRVFIDGYDPNWRHGWPGRPIFDWFSRLTFWVGLVVAVRRYRRPAYVFLLSLLGVMWLPALLSKPAFHTLRLSGILPAYYALAAVGLLTLAGWLSAQVPRVTQYAIRQPVVILVVLLLCSGLPTFYDYFYRWTGLPEVYQAFEGPVAALAQKLAAEKGNVIIPYYLYTHASMRYLLDSRFQEEVFVPEPVLATLDQQPIILVIPEYPADDGLPPAFVWLTRNGAGVVGTAYVSAVVRGVSLSTWNPELIAAIRDDQSNVIARQYQVDGQKLAPFFLPEPPRKKAAVGWGDNLALTGYEFVPATIKPGETSSLYLTWQILGYTGLTEKMFVQFLDSRGHPVGQQEVDPISRKMYRWRDDGLILERFPLELGTDPRPGLYFVRLGFFDPQTGRRLPAYSPDQKPLGDEWIVGPLYVSENGVIGPQYAVQAMLGNSFELLGYSLYPASSVNSTEIELYWKTHAPVDLNYTVFVQLLDPQNQVIAQVDAQPLANIYPTSRWQPGDIIFERFVLPVARDELGGRLVTGMYDLATGVRLPAYNEQGDLLPKDLIQLSN